MANTSHRKPYMNFRLVHLRLTFAHPKDHSEGHAYFYCEYLVKMMTDMANITPATWKVMHELSIGISTFGIEQF